MQSFVSTRQKENISARDENASPALPSQALKKKLYHFPADTHTQPERQHVDADAFILLTPLFSLRVNTVDLGRLELRNDREPVLQLRPAATVLDWEPKKSVLF